MEFKTITSSEIDACKKLYEDVGWSVYLKDEQAFKTMFYNALYTLGAYDKGQLVGLIRMIGDDAHILYIQDILVLKKYQGQGIGRKLLSLGLDKFAHVRQKVLLTDDDPNTVGFYQSCGMKKAQDLKLVSFVRFD